MFRVTSLTDLAGQITAKCANADQVTIGTVYLPTGALRTIRKRLPSGLPKWRDATDHDVRYVTELVIREALGIGVGSIDKTTQAWKTFWADAQAVHSKAASIEGGRIGYMKAATLVKFVLIGHAVAAGLGHAISTGQIPRPRTGRGHLHVAEDVVVDNEIQGDDNREALVTIWRSTNEHQPMLNSLDITRKAKSLTLTTEQAEPLLLLADYVAGLAHAKRSRADVLARSQVTRATAEASMNRIIGSGRLQDFTGSVRLQYFDIYPEFRAMYREGAA
ncbi:hypothetical protein [Piscinibacter defluvii]|uniref:hypothetical protein n=1 Tax=Piscinibacter defluvii TaxID=1796922 RepID=UPI000FDE1462|nr:hypothetical protein [Piscinibacter defluvii]